MPKLSSTLVTLTEQEAHAAVKPEERDAVICDMAVDVSLPVLESKAVEGSPLSCSVALTAAAGVGVVVGVVVGLTVAVRVGDRV